MLRLIVNKAKHHYNVALDHAERGRLVEAIDELNNAVDLDKRFVNAYVVLGTLHAKQGDFDKAREAWMNALAIQPELSKAHSYLEKAQTVERALPALRRFRIGMIVLASLAVLLLGWIVWDRAADRGADTLKAAETAYREGHYGRAIRDLSLLKQSADAATPVSAAGSALRAAIEADMRSQVRAIQELKFRERFPEALAAIKQLEGREPDEPTSAALAVVKEDIGHYFVEKIQKLYEGYDAGTVAYSELENKIQEFSATYPQSPDRDEILAYLGPAQEAESIRRMDAIRADFPRNRDLAAALASVERIATETAHTELFERARSEVVQELLTQEFEREQQLMDEGNFAEARKILDSIRTSGPGIADVVKVDGPVELAYKVLEDEERTQRLREAEELIAQGEFLDAQQGLVELVLSDGLTTAERDLVQSLQEKLEKTYDAERLKTLQRRDAELMSQTISDTDASSTLRMAMSLLSSTRLSRNERSAVLAYAAAASFKLGRKEAATRYTTQLRELESRSKYLQTLDKLLKKKSPR